MQKAKLSWLFIFNVLLAIILTISLAKPSIVQSALATNVVISEVQLGVTGLSTNEFIEIYNPTGSSIDISSWKITKKTAAADPVTGQVLLATVPASTTIASHGYYLIGHSDFTGTEDLSYSGDSISTDNSIYMKNGSDAVMDKLGLGSTNDPETTAKTNPSTGDSVERKANASSTGPTMIGSDALLGNGEDTDVNSADFVNRGTPEPQNSQSATEDPAASPSPSSSASASPSSSPPASPSPSASASPSSSPSSSPSASPSASPSSSPSVSPSASISPSPSQTPHPSPTPRPKNKLVCKFEPQTFKFGKWEFTFHILSCKWIKV